MSCLACTKNFGFFTREVGCPSCGFSFCSKCLKKSIVVPRLNNSKQKVCLTCYDRIGKAEPNQARPLSAEPTKNPLDAECNDLPTPAMQVNDEPRPKIDPDNTDEIIKHRLTKLKEDRLNRVHLQPTSDTDIAIRIANLKGERFLGETKKDTSLLLNIDCRSDQEKCNDLVSQYTSEAQLDDNADPIKDIERRLAALKGAIPDVEASHSKSLPIAGTDNDSDSDNDEIKIKRLVGRYMEEAALVPADENPELTPEEQEFVAGVKPGKDQEELPWCVICNEDSVIRYQGDLFCRQCYKEVREDE